MIMEEIKRIQVNPEVSVKETMKIMDATSMETVLVVDEEERLMGIVTDGDIRRALLSGSSIEDSVSKVMNRNYSAVSVSTPVKEIIRRMKKYYFKQMPVIDEERKVVDMYLLKDIIAEKSKDNYVVLMAGGLGTRLRPLTDDKPKPMIEIGGRPILEIIINLFKNYGFKNFFISVNYLANIVEGYFGDGSDFDVNIQYIRETSRLGTAGCLKLVEDKLTKPFFVVNGDLLTRLNLEDMLKFHAANSFDMTVGIRKHDYQIPYGVVETEGNRISKVIEKPMKHCTINAGIYCLNPEIISYIPENKFYDITSLINACLSQGKKIGGFHIVDYWMDIGQIEDYKKANIDYDLIFKDFIRSEITQRTER
ncbi:MAG: nucleotidyltransferase family protein [Clostridia bacterium]|nr:nucleotidyltransferase family protein [Clostridia bacterium]